MALHSSSWGRQLREQANAAATPAASPALKALTRPSHGRYEGGKGGKVRREFGRSCTF